MERPVREWLDVNGTGGYASGTIDGVFTRKYHGLLVANLGSPAWGRHVLVSWLQDEVLDADGVAIGLAPGVATRDCPAPPVCSPSEFCADLFSEWLFRVNGLSVVRSIACVEWADLVLVRYRTEDRPVRLRLRLLLAYRRNHELAHENDFFDSCLTSRPNGFSVSPYVGMPPLHVCVEGASACRVEPVGEWVRGVYYAAEEKRGYPCMEDCFVPAALTLTLQPGHDCQVLVGTEAGGELKELWEKETARRRHARRAAAMRSENSARVRLQELAARLDLAAGSFLVHVPPDGRSTVLAGYHWFEDWGRDTMIALPGVTFCRGGIHEGLEVLKTFCRQRRNGRIPNFIGPAGGQPAYNSVDGSLWLFWAVQEYLQHGGEAEELRADIWPAMKEIIGHFAAGSHADARMCEDGRLYCGSPDTQLTWMDASPGGRPVTPRWGHPIEINALWYNALCFAGELSIVFEDAGYQAPCSIEQLAEVMRAGYWFETGGYLADNINESGVDCKLRPNQVFALSLPHAAFTPEQGRSALQAVRNELLTPRGLRTLSPRDFDYKGRCDGPVEERDAAYHQGTVWPWLLGGFGEAWLRVHAADAEARDFLTDYLSGWTSHLDEAGVNSVSEIFDGDAPHTPRGCISQAWSVAELLRLVHLVNGR